MRFIRVPLAAIALGAGLWAADVQPASAQDQGPVGEGFEAERGDEGGFDWGLLGLLGLAGLMGLRRHDHTPVRTTTGDPGRPRV